MDRKKFIKETWLDFPVLETDRLVLRQINMDINDAKDLFNNLYNDDDVIKYDWRKVDSIGDFSKPMFQGGNTVIGKMINWRNGHNTFRTIDWAIVLKETNELIGFRKIILYDVGLLETECKLAKQYWGKGIMAEASMKIYSFLEQVGYNQIVNTINSTNSRAIRLNQKLGFKEVKINDLFFNKEPSDIDIMEMKGLIERLQNPKYKSFAKLPLKIKKKNFFQRLWGK